LEGLRRDGSRQRLVGRIGRVKEVSTIVHQRGVDDPLQPKVGVVGRVHLRRAAHSLEVLQLAQGRGVLLEFFLDGAVGVVAEENEEEVLFR